MITDELSLLRRPDSKRRSYDTGWNAAIEAAIRVADRSVPSEHRTSRSWRLDLPYLLPPLSLNDRGQTVRARQARSAEAARVKGDVIMLARAARIPRLSRIHVRLHYLPATNIRRDADNLVATLKPCLDGLVKAGVVPDDTDEFVDWSKPMIHRAEEHKSGPARAKSSLWLEIHGS